DLLELVELPRVAAAERHAVDVSLAVAIGHETEPRAVGREGRLAAGLARVGDLARLTRRGIADPDFGLVCVLVPVGFAEAVSDELAAGRDRRRGHTLEVDQIV